MSMQGRAHASHTRPAGFPAFAKVHSAVKRQLNENNALKLKARTDTSELPPPPLISFEDILRMENCAEYLGMQPDEVVGCPSMSPTQEELRARMSFMSAPDRVSSVLGAGERSSMDSSSESFAASTDPEKWDTRYVDRDSSDSDQSITNTHTCRHTPCEGHVPPPPPFSPVPPPVTDDDDDQIPPPPPISPADDTTLKSPNPDSNLQPKSTSAPTSEESFSPSPTLALTLEFQPLSPNSTDTDTDTPRDSLVQRMHRTGFDHHRSHISPPKLQLERTPSEQTRRWWGPASAPHTPTYPHTPTHTNHLTVLSTLRRTSEADTDTPTHRTAEDMRSQSVDGIPTHMDENTRVCTYAELIGQEVPAFVDVRRKEDYLDEDEFNRLFKMTHEQFRSLPTWRQVMRKRELRLF